MDNNRFLTFSSDVSSSDSGQSQSYEEMMKKIVCILLTLVLIFAFSGCKEKSIDPIPTDEELNSSELTSESDLNGIIIEEPPLIEEPESDIAKAVENTQPVSKDDYDPPRGENHTITGVPDPVDTIDSDNGDIQRAS